jgi:hypothetical protein
MIVLLLITILSLIWDYKQTLNIKNFPSLHEINKILGEHPSDIKIISYFGLCISSLIAVTLFAPVGITFIILSGTLILEAIVIRSNIKLGL